VTILGKLYSSAKCPGREYKWGVLPTRQLRGLGERGKVGDNIRM